MEGVFMIVSRILMAVALLLATWAPRAAVAQPSAIDVRQAQIDNVISGLNSLDPAKRLATFEQAMASSDRTLRRIALSTAFASSDTDLRAIALDKAIASVSTFVVQITGTGSSSCVRSAYDPPCKGVFQNGLGSNFAVRIAHFNPSFGTFDAWSSFSGRQIKQAPSPSSWPPIRPKYVAITHQGSVSGGQLSFEVDASGLAGLPTVSYLPQLQARCSGTARLQGGDAILKGSMTCSGSDNVAFSDTENFLIEINVLG